jgi:hypothetical protein
VPYIMEFLEGEDLGPRLQRVGRLDPRATHRTYPRRLGQHQCSGTVPTRPLTLSSSSVDPRIVAAEDQ